MSFNIFSFIEKQFKKYDIDNIDFIDKTIIVTGATSGIGQDLIEIFSLLNAKKIILASRNTEKGIDVVNKIKKKTQKNNIHFMELDLLSFKSIDLFIKNFEKENDNLDILINNAGIYTKKEYTRSGDGYEIMLQTNYLSQIYLTLKLLSLMNYQRSYIISISSFMNYFANIDYLNLINKDINVIDYFNKNDNYDYNNVYSITKLLLSIFMKKLGVYLQNKNVKIFTLTIDPGLVKTNLINEKKNTYKEYIFWILSFFIYKTSKNASYEIIYTFMNNNHIPNGSYCSGGIKENYKKVNQIFEDILWNETIKKLNLEKYIK